jgi:hypothetical protein
MGDSQYSALSIFLENIRLQSSTGVARIRPDFRSYLVDPSPAAHSQYALVLLEEMVPAVSGQLGRAPSLELLEFTLVTPVYPVNFFLALEQSVWRLIERIKANPSLREKGFHALVQILLPQRPFEVLAFLRTLSMHQGNGPAFKYEQIEKLKSFWISVNALPNLVSDPDRLYSVVHDLFLTMRQYRDYRLKSFNLPLPWFCLLPLLERISRALAICAGVNAAPLRTMLAIDPLFAVALPSVSQEVFLAPSLLPPLSLAYQTMAPVDMSIVSLYRPPIMISYDFAVSFREDIEVDQLTIAIRLFDHICGGGAARDALTLVFLSLSREIPSRGIFEKFLDSCTSPIQGNFRDYCRIIFLSIFDGPPFPATSHLLSMHRPRIETTLQGLSDESPIGRKASYVYALLTGRPFVEPVTVCLSSCYSGIPVVTSQSLQALSRKLHDPLHFFTFAASVEAFARQARPAEDIALCIRLAAALWGVGFNQPRWSYIVLVRDFTLTFLARSMRLAPLAFRLASTDQPVVFLGALALFAHQLPFGSPDILVLLDKHPNFLAIIAQRAAISELPQVAELLALLFQNLTCLTEATVRALGVIPDHYFDYRGFMRYANSILQNEHARKIITTIPEVYADFLKEGLFFLQAKNAEVIQTAGFICFWKHMAMIKESDEIVSCIRASLDSSAHSELTRQSLREVVALNPKLAALVRRSNDSANMVSSVRWTPRIWIPEITGAAVRLHIS